jgi:cytochrome c553
MRTTFAFVLMGGLAAMTAPALAANVENGKAKAVEYCADCHGDDGKGDKDTPKVVGIAQAEFIKAMKEYQSGVRTKSKKMTKAANKVTDEEIADMAAYYETLPK